MTPLACVNAICELQEHRIRYTLARVQPRLLPVPEKTRHQQRLARRRLWQCHSCPEDAGEGKYYCDRCRQAHNARQNALRARRRAERDDSIGQRSFFRIAIARRTHGES